MNSERRTFNLLLTHVDMGWFLPDPSAESGDSAARAAALREAILAGDRDAAASFASTLVPILLPATELLLETASKVGLETELYLSPPAESSLADAGILSLLEGYDKLNALALTGSPAGERRYAPAEGADYRYDLRNGTFINWSNSMLIGLNRYMPNRKAFQVRGMLKGRLPAAVEYSSRSITDDTNKYEEPGLYLAGLPNADLLGKTLKIISGANESPRMRSLRLSLSQIDPIAYISINAMRRASGERLLDRDTCTIFTVLPAPAFGGGPFPRPRVLSRGGRIEFDCWYQAPYPGIGTRFTIGLDE